MLWHGFNGVGITFVLSLRATERSAAILNYLKEIATLARRSASARRHVVSLLAMTFHLFIY
jgi:hypothetical protein